MAKKIPKQAELVQQALNTTGLAVVLMTPEDLQARIPSQYQEMFPKTYLSGFEMAPKMDPETIGKRQLIVIYDESLKDSDGKPTGKVDLVVKLFDRINNLTTMDSKQTKISPTYVTRMNYRIENNEQALDVFNKNVMENVLSFRKLIDDPEIVK